MIERFSSTGTILSMHIDTITPVDIAWQERALCAQTGADFFFPDPGSSVREAKRICGMCEMRTACLDYALANDERFGVWGGLSEKERLHLRRAGRG
ncbi:WhiB family transcriptional regulator [Streptomyces sp. JV178]|nr:WhiB family transcriptional regulator [Streptomyces sp. JV178]